MKNETSVIFNANTSARRATVGGGAYAPAVLRHLSSTVTPIVEVAKPAPVSKSAPRLAKVTVGGGAFAPAVLRHLSK
jgi:uncharacterized protein (DUF1786 family)